MDECIVLARSIDVFQNKNGRLNFIYSISKHEKTTVYLANTMCFLGL